MTAPFSTRLIYNVRDATWEGEMRIVGTALAMLLAVAAAGACGGAQTETRPAATAPAADANSLQSRFSRAYFAIACIANAGKDPEMTITPLRKPADYLEGLESTKSPKLPHALEILSREGFPTLEMFRGMETRLRGDHRWWQKEIDDPFIDQLKKCP